jgi:hypothetical protein
MFETGRADTTEGTSDDHPIILEGIPTQEWEVMLRIIYPPHWYVLNTPLASSNFMMPIVYPLTGSHLWSCIP